MAQRFSMLTLAACLAAVTAPSAVSERMPDRLRSQALSGHAQLRAFGGRSEVQRRSSTAAKFDGALADLIRHAALARPASLLADLHSMSPAARFKLAADGSALVLIDAVTRGDPAKLDQALLSLGLQRPALFANDVSGWLPVSQLQAAAALSDVHSMRASLARTRSGAVTTQGDFVQRSGALRNNKSLTGGGVTVGVLSDSFDCYAVYAQSGSGVPASGYAGYAYNGFLATAATDESTGDLPASVNVLTGGEADCLDYGAPLQPPFGDEGRAMLQIVHDVAPGAALDFYTAENGEAAFAAGIQKLATAGALVIADDVGYFDEPFFQDGIVAQAIDNVAAQGVVYLSAAGNDGDAAYDNTNPSFATVAPSGSDNAGEHLLNFDTSGASTATSLPITIDALAPGELAAVIVQWDQPYVTGAPNSGGATSSLDLCVSGATSEYTILDYDNDPVTCTGANKLGADPVQILIIANPASATASTPQETLNIAVGLVSGTAPGRLKISVATDGQRDYPIGMFATHSATLQGHPGAAGAAAVGAAFYFDTPDCGTTPATLESYSSLGGTPLLFDSSGNRLATPLVRQRPNFVAPDGGNDTFLGFTLVAAGDTGSDGQLSTSIPSCQNNAAYPNFFGTSAATPHVAGIAALMLQANSSLTATQIVDALQSSALSMNGTTPSLPDFSTGYGFVQADAAFAALPAVVPPQPSLSAADLSIAVGGSTTLTWKSANATTCTASGSWTGTQAISGTFTVSGTTAGDYTYSLTCENSTGSSSAANVTVSVGQLPGTVVASNARHGGGGLSALQLAELALVALSLGAGRRRRRGLAQA